MNSTYRERRSDRRQEQRGKGADLGAFQHEE